MNSVPVPISIVVNLTDTFGGTDETTRFVKRHLRTQHADLFFADALILVEGTAERMLLPHFIQRGFNRVDQGYVTLLEVGGSHAHRLRPLIEQLGLPTLVITDLDAQEKKVTPATETSTQRTTYVAAQPKLGVDLTTNNDTLKRWLPQQESLDNLLSSNVVKTLQGAYMHEVRVAYQMPVEIDWPPAAPTRQRAFPYTFEDALAFANLTAFEKMPGPGLLKSFRAAISESSDVSEIGMRFFAALRDKADKGQFALNVLQAEAFDTLACPQYIAEGLKWLERELQSKQLDILSTATGDISAA